MDRRRYPGVLTGIALAAGAALGVAGRAQEEGVLGEPEAQLLILGTFHFEDAGLDSYEPAFDVDALSPERQDEVKELLELLAGFGPTRIALEVDLERQEELDASYAAYRTGEKEATSDEIQQIGFRLAARLGHQRVFAVDAERRFYEPWVDPDEWAAAHGLERLVEREERWAERYERLYRHDDELKTRQTLREHLLYVNSPERLRRGHGHYVSGTFAAGGPGEHPGADSTTAWYNRNLRILANVLRLAGPGERILLVIGAGHVPILHHAADASPEVALVEVAEVLGEATP